MGYLLSPVVAALLLLNSTIDYNYLQTDGANETKNITVSVSVTSDVTPSSTKTSTFSVTSEPNKIAVELQPITANFSETNPTPVAITSPAITDLPTAYSQEGFTSDVSPFQAQKFESVGEETFKKIKELEESNKWKTLPKKGVEKLREKRVTTFRGSVNINVPAHTMFEELWYRGSNTPEWHKQVESAMELANVTEHSKVLYQTAAPQANGMISRRDFVTLSYYVKEEGKYYIVYKSVDYDGKPEVQGIIRGTNGPSAMIMEPIQGEGCESKFTWYMNTDFNLKWVPASMLRALFPSFVKGYLDSVVIKARQLREEETDC